MDRSPGAIAALDQATAAAAETGAIHAAYFRALVCGGVPTNIAGELLLHYAADVDGYYDDDADEEV